MERREFNRNRLFLKMLINQKNISAPEQRRVNGAWLKFYGKPAKFTTCGSCLRDRIRNLLQEFLTDAEKLEIKEKIRQAKMKRNKS